MATLSIDGGIKHTAAVFSTSGAATVPSATQSSIASLASTRQTFSGHDTINLGVGSDTIFQAGNATVHGIFGSATIAGGAVAFLNAGNLHEEKALSGKETLLGGASSHEFVGTKSTLLRGGVDMFLAGAGADTLLGGASRHLFEISSAGQHVITNFVAGKDQLYLEGQSLSYLQQHHDITVKGGNTYISLDGGKTTVELHGVTGLKSSDITTHKP